MARTIVTCNNDFVNYDNIVSITILKTDDEEDADFNEIVNIYVEAYIKGMEIMRILQVSYAEIYETNY